MKVLSDVRRKPRVQTVNDLPSLTKQSEVHRSEMRHILAKYEQTGVLVGLRDVDLAYRDVTEFTDFADLMRQTKEAEAAFMRLPSKVRELFDHSVEQWLDTAHDADKLDALRPQLEEMGILEAVAGPATPPEPSPEPVPSPEG